ncbi:DNA-directed RNA polymerase III subunit rpc1 [Sphaceloma murrayae]|uniref:DNA-directed RNA polymerase III subunit rpc1 n=1 Tax=Sphaceloma murrayae TaxID=2082308 RepID=A0A2K1QFH3_9PEZI|nr:DNA-directed RNA polymerase III subunit rpc1 [Sphaceloma murrayae]
MRRVLLFAAVAIVGALAQTRTSTDLASSTISRSPATHTVNVGKADHIFEPNNLRAEVGDTVVFEFYPLNHSVVRADYRYPCVPYETSGSKRQGFYSGFFPVDRIGDDMPQWNITIKDTLPIFYYCSAPGSCINYGMIGAINPNSSAQVSEQQTLARAAKYMLQPGEPFPAEASASSTTIAAATATITSSRTTSPSSSPSSNPAPSPPSLSKGAIAGIAIAAIAALAILGALFYLIGRHRSMKKNLTLARSTVPHTSYNPHGAHLFSYAASTNPPSEAGHGSTLNGTGPPSASAAGRWSSHRTSAHATDTEKDAARTWADEVGSVRSMSPPAHHALAHPSTPFGLGFPAGAGMPPVTVSSTGSGVPGWYFDPAAMGPQQSVELRGSEVGRGSVVEWEGQSGEGLHELEARRNSGLPG